MAEQQGSVLTDYDFQLGKNHFRGSGWRGLAALGVILIFRLAILGILVVSARPASAWLINLLR
jgi:hypothetical protein